MGISRLNPSEGGIPKGNTANRSIEFPSPQIGDVYYNGQIEALEIYNGTTWKVSKTEGFPPDAPTISSVTDSSTSLAYSSTAGTLDVVFVPAGTGGAATQYNAYTTTGGHSGFTTVGNTVTITGLTPGTAYSVYGNAQNGSGTSTNTSNFAAVTPTTLPQVPIIGTATTSNSVSEATVTWTLGNNGGKSLTSITITPYLNGTTAETPRTAATTSSTSYTFTAGQLTAGANYTFKVKATNANGTSSESSATNSITVPLFFNLETLVVAGGGGGGGAGGDNGWGGSGGGGGGGLLYTSSINVIANTLIPITIGAGGTGAANSSGSLPTNGTNSVFIGTAIGGGRGGTQGSSSGANGGSGGGEAYTGAVNGVSTQNNSEGLTGFGFSGGASGNDSGAGGGGAGGVGNPPAGNTQGGNGGSGKDYTFNGSLIGYAGGGGGGSYHGSNTSSASHGGSGGGNGNSIPSNALSNRGGGGGGGGGGGSGTGTKGANGGSGIVIIKIPDTRTATFSSGVAFTGGSASGGFKTYTVTAAGTSDTVTFS